MDRGGTEGNARGSIGSDGNFGGGLAPPMPAVQLGSNLNDAAQAQAAQPIANPASAAASAQQ